MRIIFGSPAVLDQEIRPILEKRFLQHKSTSQYRFKFKTYINIQLVSTILMLSLLTAFYAETDIDDQLFVVSFILITLINCGALMEQRKWIYYLECIRLILVTAFICWKLDCVEVTVLPIICLFIIDEVFNIRSLYNNYVLIYEEV